MWKQSLVLFIALGMGMSLGFCADSETSHSLIGQTWYCTDNYQGIHRYIFNPNGTFSEAFFTPTGKRLKYWNPGATAIRFTIVSSSQIKILDSSFNPPFITIQALSPQQFRFAEGSSTYTCSHTPPPEDTPANAVAVAAERSAEERFFYGKWITRDGLQSVEFFPDGTCVITSHVTGNMAIDISMYKGTVRGKSSLYSGGNDIQCGGAGAFSRVGPNRIEFSAESATISLYRGSENRPKPVGALTVTIAQTVLNQKINLPTVNNTLFTCHACYDPSDKEDNDKAPLVTTYSVPLSQFLIEDGYVRIDGQQQVFTAKAKRSKY